MSKKVFSFVFVVGIAISYGIYRELLQSLPIPQFDINEYWGPGKNTSNTDDNSILPFQISYSNNTIEDLKQRLSRNVDYHQPLEDVGFQYGFNSIKLKEIIKFWRFDYLPRWKERVNYLNQFNHFTTKIQGLKIHFIHIKPTERLKKSKKVLPLLLLHGWPGSVREFYDMITKLMNNDKDDFIFEVIAPSLPGFGWSEGSYKKGFGPPQAAIVIRNLMMRLGHEKFLIQGGDWGSVLGSNIATLFPHNVLGYHSNFCFMRSPLAWLKYITASLYPVWFAEKDNVDFYYPIYDKVALILEESGYFHLQATKPDTIGIALTDNPVGLAVYILEKFSTGTNIEYRKLVDGGFDNYYKMDQLLDNVMIYYLTNSMPTSNRFYAEATMDELFGYNLNRVQSLVLTGCARFKYDFGHSLNWQLIDKFPNLIHSKNYQIGGHYPAFQLPNVLYDDLMDFIRKVVKIQSII